MRSKNDYVALLSSWLGSKPNFVAVISGVAAAFADVQAFLSQVPNAFGLDTAIGVQLDAVGKWIGITRDVAVPLSNVYFSFDIAGLGFDQGFWFGPFNPVDGVVVLDDESYRNILYVKQALNNWNGQKETMVAALQNLFNGTGATVFAEDHQDMTMFVCVAGGYPNAIALSLLAGNELPFRPAGVQVTYYVSSVPDTPLFGFDIETSLISGFDVGSWGVQPSI